MIGTQHPSMIKNFLFSVPHIAWRTLPASQLRNEGTHLGEITAETSENGITVSMVEVTLSKPFKSVKLSDISPPLPRSILYTLRTVRTAPPRLGSGKPLPIAADDVGKIMPVVNLPLVIIFTSLREPCLPPLTDLGFKDFRVNPGMKDFDMMPAHK